MLAINGVDNEVVELSVQQLVDCNRNGQYGCGGGWMLEAFKYISNYGALKREDYRAFSKSQKDCGISVDDLKKERHVSDIGYIEHDGRSNDEYKALL